VHALQADVSPLRRVFDALPATLLHGDLKLGNAALDDAGTLWLIDWSLVTRAPVALEIAWALTINSSRLPWPLDDTIDRYAGHLRAALGARFDDAEWRTQRHAIGIAGLLIYAWGKTLDYVDYGSRELSWWCDRALEAADAFGW
jgi:thiamine kinase-like enzyme